ncbi:MAG: cysteine synthase A [Rhizobiales bacterium]|nr:cysteine synthase A [Hyphomicrobiales bacterium]
MSESFEFKTIAGRSDWGHGRVYGNIAETIGNTPLVRLNRIAERAGARATVLLKLEFFNPLSSVKDRIGVSMIDALEAAGKLGPDSHMIEPTSGNTGIGLAFVAAARGYKLTLVMPESMSIERRKLFHHLGANLELTPAAKGMKGAIARADEMLAADPKAVQPSQFANPANPAIHEQTTAEEIWRDTGGKFDAMIAGVGTGGTITGCGRVFKKRNPAIRVVAVEPQDSPVLSGGDPGPHKIQGIGAGFKPAVLDMSLVDEVLKVSNEESFETARQLARLEGIPGGISTGANVAAALKYAARSGMEGKTIVTVSASAAERYFSSLLFPESVPGLW